MRRSSLKPIPTAADKHVGHLMRLRRQEIGLTKQELAAKIGVSRQQLEKYEAGINRLTVGALIEIAASLRVSPGYFFNDSRETLREVGEAAELIAQIARSPDALIILRCVARLPARTQSLIAGLLQAIVETKISSDGEA